MNIMKLRPIFLIVSLTLISISIFSIFKWQFKKSIDFAGGTVWEINIPSKPQKEKIEEIFSQNQVSISSVSSSDESKYLLKFENINPEQKLLLNTSFSNLDQNYTELRFETLGPLLGKELVRKTITAIVLSSLFLLFFIGKRFKDISFGISALIAMFHDTIILLGSFSLLGHFLGAELDSLFVTALLTTLASSVHDTVVTFDRIRELKRQNYKINWIQLTNQAVTETLTRSLNNSMTIILMLFALVMLGGQTTKWFAAALLIGVISGTYSSIGVAVPFMLFWKRKENKV